MIILKKCIFNKKLVKTIKKITRLIFVTIKQHLKKNG